MSIKPLADRVVIKNAEPEEKTKSGIILTGTAKEKPQVCEVVAVGPVPMMQAVAQLTADFGIRTTVSLNSLMVDGMGMCGACRVTVGGETRFTCVDGPEFDGHQVDFAELRSRLSAFNAQEKLSLDDYKEHRCRCRDQGEQTPA